MAAYLRNRFGDTRTVVLSESMGGLTGLAVAAATPAAVWVGISPVTSVRWAAHRQSFASSVHTAWKSEPVEPPAPSGRAVACVGDSDDYVPTATNAAALKGRAAQVEIVTRPGKHIPTSCYDDALSLVG